MCTLTIVPTTDRRVRVAFNRDESPDRPAGLPPARRRFGNRAALLPTDPHSGGTWLAVNDAGLVLAVLNVTPPAGKGPPGRRSRGEVIPALAHADSPVGALEDLPGRLEYRDFAPFRLVLVGCGVVADVRWDGREPVLTSRLLGGTPGLFTSSGLGDHLVEGVRGELFGEHFAGPPETWEAGQAAFHRHRWPGSEHLSVNMTRATARTVSFSVVEVGAERATFSYHPGQPDRPGPGDALELILAAGAPR